MYAKIVVFVLALGSTARAYSYSSVLDSGDSRAFFAPSSSQSNQLGNSFGVPVYNPSAARADLFSQADAQAAMAQIAAYQQEARSQTLAQQAAQTAVQAQQQQAFLAQEQARSQATIAAYQQAEAQEQARAQTVMASYREAEAQEQARVATLAQQQEMTEVQQELARTQALAAQSPAGVPTITRITVLQPVASTYTASQDVADSQLAAFRQALTNQQWSQQASSGSSGSYGNYGSYGQQASSVQPLPASNNYRSEGSSPASSYVSQISSAPVSTSTTSTGPLYSSESFLSSGLSPLTVSQLLSLLGASGAGTRVQPVANSGGSFAGTLASQYGSGQSRQTGGYYWS